MNRRIGVVLSYVLMIFEVLSTLLLTPFIISTLGQAEYGVYKLAAAINSYLLLLDLGIGNAIVRYIAKYRAENNKLQEERFLGVATIFYGVIAIIAVIIGLIIIKTFPSMFAQGLSYSEIKLAQKLLGITMINSAVTLGTAAYANVLIAYEAFTASKGSSIVQIVFRMLLTIIVLKIGMGSIGIVCVNLLMTIACRMFFIIYTLMKLRLKPIFQGIDADFIKEVTVYSLLILLQMIATQINSTVDQIMIGALVLDSSVILAVYGVGTQIVSYFQSMGMAFTGVLMPGIVNLVQKQYSEKAVLTEMIRVGRIIFMVLIFIWGGFLVNGQNFVILWAGMANKDAFYVAIILMSAQLFVLTEMVGTQILWALNQHREQSILKIFIVLCNIVITALLIKWKPLIGATIGTFISLVLGDIVVMNVIFQFKLKINVRKYYFEILKGIIPCIIISIFSGVVVKHFICSGWFALAVNIFVMTVVFWLGMYFRGMNEYEKGLVKSIIKRIKFIF